MQAVRFHGKEDVRVEEVAVWPVYLESSGIATSGTSTSP